MPSFLEKDDAKNALWLSLLAGLSTGLGAMIVFFVRLRSKKGDKHHPVNDRHMTLALSLAGSVMITVSVCSLLPESFSEDHPKSSTTESSTTDNMNFLSHNSYLFWERVACFVAGCGIYLLLSKCAFPEPDAILELGCDPEAPNETFSQESDKVLKSSPVAISRRPKGQDTLRIRTSSSITDDESKMECDSLLIAQSTDKENAVSTGNDAGVRTLLPARCCNQFSLGGSDLTSSEARRSWRVAMLLFVSLAIHNFPEGFAVAASSMHSPKLGVTTAIAIALHNIPEGIAIAIPCLAARPDSPWLAFWLASLSGLAEPFGAFVALAVMDSTVGREESNGEHLSTALSTKDVLSFVAGIMIMVALAELFPEALRHSKDGERLTFVCGSLLGVVVMVVSEWALESKT